MIYHTADFLLAGRTLVESLARDGLRILLSCVVASCWIDVFSRCVVEGLKRGRR